MICRPWFSRPVRHRRPPLTPTARARSGFTAYGVTQEDDPLSQAMRGLVDGAACHEEQLAKLWEVVEKLSVQMSARDCVPCEPNVASISRPRRSSRSWASKPAMAGISALQGAR
jgi:hypothetical protein